MKENEALRKELDEAKAKILDLQTFGCNLAAIVALVAARSGEGDLGLEALELRAKIETR